MAAFSIDNLLSKPFETTEIKPNLAELNKISPAIDEKISPAGSEKLSPLTLSTADSNFRPGATNLMYTATSSLLNPAFHSLYTAAHFQSGFLPSAPHPPPRFSSGIAELTSSLRLKSANMTMASPNISTSMSGSWSEHEQEQVTPDKNDCKVSMNREEILSDLGDEIEDLEEDEDSLTRFNSTSGSEEKDKNMPEPRRMLIKDTNGQIKELIFPRGLDLDRPKRERTSFTPEQLFRLEKEFSLNQYMVGRDRGQLATCLGLTETQVKVWFQNRRTKYKREKQREQDTKKSDMDTLAACSMFKILEQSTGQYYTASGPRLFATPAPNTNSTADPSATSCKNATNSVVTNLHSKYPNTIATSGGFIVPHSMGHSLSNQMAASSLGKLNQAAANPSNNWSAMHGSFMPSSLYWVGTAN